MMTTIYWKLWIIKNYDYVEGSVISGDEIMENGKEVGELTKKTLGLIITDVWGTKVQKIRPQNDKCRQYYYKNLKLRNVMDNECRSNGCALDGLFQMIEVPLGWTKGYEKSGHIRFLKLNLQRCMVEISVKQSGDDEEPDMSIMCHNVTVAVEKEASFMPLSGLSLMRKVMVLQKFIDSSKLCEGIAMYSDEEVVTVEPYIVYNVNHEYSGTGIKKIAYSTDCEIFALNQSRHCTGCCNLNKNNQKRLARKEKRTSISGKTNKRYLSKDDIEMQLTDERKRRKSAEQKEMYWKNKFDVESVEMEEEDHDDLVNMLYNVDGKGEIPENLSCLWEQQKKILKTSSKCGYRWHPKIIRLCLDLYCKNPHVLEPLREFMTLPSNRTIRLYKNKVDQTPGWTNAILCWCKEEAKKSGLKEDGYWGGFVIDEMKIQEDLEMVVKNGKHRLVGFVNLGEAHESMMKLTGIKINTHRAWVACDHVSFFLHFLWS